MITKVGVFTNYQRWCIYQEQLTSRIAEQVIRTEYEKVESPAEEQNQVCDWKGCYLQGRTE